MGRLRHILRGLVQVVPGQIFSRALLTLDLVEQTVSETEISRKQDYLRFSNVIYLQGKPQAVQCAANGDSFSQKKIAKFGSLKNRNL